MFTLSAHYARIALGAIAILAFLTFAAYYATVRPTFAANNAVSSPAVIATLAQRPLETNAGSCAGTYVTGDMVGDASPATVYATAASACRP
jgi:hypothetical protein